MSRGKYLNLFISKLFGEDDEISSKRFVAIVTWSVIVVIAFVDLFSNLSITYFIFEGLLIIVLGGLGLTSIEKYIENKQNVTQPKK